jgi:uncharacterized protein YqeY
MIESIQDRIQSDMTAAMKAKDADTLSTLRMLKAALMEARTKKPKGAEFTADEEIEILMRYAKKRRETIDELRKADREDLVAREEQEIAVTQRYLPQAISEDELKVMIRAAAERVGAAGPKDAGKVIGAVLGQVKGRADGGTVSRLVREVLGA